MENENIIIKEERESTLKNRSSMSLLITSEGRFPTYTLDILNKEESFEGKRKKNNKKKKKKKKKEKEEKEKERKRKRKKKKKEKRKKKKKKKKKKKEKKS